VQDSKNEQTPSPHGLAQSFGQVVAVSPKVESQVASPQVDGQSRGQFQNVSPVVHNASPQLGGQSPGQVADVSPLLDWQILFPQSTGSFLSQLTPVTWQVNTSEEYASHSKLPGLRIFQAHASLHRMQMALQSTAQFSAVSAPLQTLSPQTDLQSTGQETRFSLREESQMLSPQPQTELQSAGQDDALSPASQTLLPQVTLPQS